MSTNSGIQDSSNVRGSDRVPPSLATAAAYTWRLLLIGFAVALIAVVLYELKTLTVPIFVALLLTTLLLPPVQRLRARGLGDGLSMAIVFVGSLVLVGLIIYFLAGTVTAQFVDLGPQVSSGLERVTTWLKNGPLGLTEAQLDRYIDQAVGEVQANTGVLGASIVSGTKFAGEVVVGMLLTLVLTAFFLKDGDSLSGAVINRFSAENRPKVRAAASRAFHTLGSYLRGVALTGVVDAVLIGIALLIVGVPLIPVLMLLTFFGAFFPVIGAVLAGVLSILVALVNGGPTDALIILAAVIIVQQVESQLLQPFLVGRSVHLHPVVIIGGLTIGALIAGILGAFVAVPIVAMVVGAVREIEAYNRAHPKVVAATAPVKNAGAPDVLRQPLWRRFF